MSEHWFIGGEAHGRKMRTGNLPLVRIPIRASATMECHEYRLQRLTSDPLEVYVWDKFPTYVAKVIVTGLVEALANWHNTDERTAAFFSEYEPITGIHLPRLCADHPIRLLLGSRYGMNVCCGVEWSYPFGKAPVCHVRWNTIRHELVLRCYPEAEPTAIAAYQKLLRENRVLDSYLDECRIECTPIEFTVTIRDVHYCTGAEAIAMFNQDCQISTQYTRSMVRGPVNGKRECGEDETWDQYMARVKSNLDRVIAKGTKAKDVLSKLTD